MVVLMDPSCICCPTDSFGLYTFYALGIIVVDLDPMMTEGASPVYGSAIGGRRISTAQMLYEYRWGGQKPQRWLPIYSKRSFRVYSTTRRFGVGLLNSAFNTSKKLT
jgi:hypothetical protein